MRIQVPLACVLALAGVRAANAQCYQFLSGTASSLTVNITNLPTPSTQSDGLGGTAYTYQLGGLSGNMVTLVLGSTQYTGTAFSVFQINIRANPVLTTVQLSLDSTTPQPFGAQVFLENLSTDLLAGGWPPVLPGISQWPDSAIFNASVGMNVFTSTVTAITSSCNPPLPPPPPKGLGNCPCNGSDPQVGYPITVGTGNMFEQASDYKTTGANQLGFTRNYNSMQAVSNPGTIAITLGTNWRSNYDRYVVASATRASVERADGQVLTFALNAGAWTGDSDIDVKLTQSGATWTVTDADDTVETYTTAIANVGGLAVPYGQLASIKARNGYTQNLSYDASNRLLSVTDSYNRSLNLTYSGSLLQTVSTPDGLVITYGYSGNQLTSASFSTTPQTSLTYLYENPALPSALTGIIDENGNRFATWTYDSMGRGLTSQHAVGADLTSVVYDDTTGNRTVTNALGVADTYTFMTFQGVPKVTQISRAATPTTAAATRTFTYDSNGYLNSLRDWNGNQTTYSNDTHGQPLVINEAVSTAQARTTIISYDLTFVHLPQQIVTPGVTTTFGYEAGTGNLFTRTETDTTTSTVPYSTSGTARTWTNTWSNYLLASVAGPRTDLVQKTQFGYDGSGALTSITDALSHVTSITAHTGGGLPQTIVDPNGVTATLTYDGRQRPLTSTLQTSAGNLKTTWTYDLAGNLTKTTLPDGSYLSNSYDNAHRLTKITNALGEYISYTLDALGDRTASNIYNSSAALTRQHSATFDALGRMLTDIGGVSGETTTYAYDPNGNATSIQDPLGHNQTQYFDALNRRYQVIDRASGTTTTVYDTHDRVTSVTDPNGNATTYTREGFGFVTQQVSPDSGTSVYRHDLAGNVTQKTDGAGIVTNHSYDELNRELTRTFPGNPAENVSETWDQTTGHGFGVGRLTSMTDAMGAANYTYDERGNDIHESRNYGGIVRSSATSYDAANRVAGIVNPSGWAEAWLRDVAGQVTGVGIEAPSATVTTPVVSGVTHLPFGPVASLTYANGIAHVATFDPDYRQTGLKDQGTATIQNLTYSYDANDNLKTITDTVNAANGQTLGYDNLDRLTDAASGAGGYGTLHWNYDANGNRSSETLNGATTNYSYAPGTNRLIMTGTAVFGYNGAGEITTQPGSPAMDFAYDQSEQLATATRAIVPPALPRGRPLRPDLSSYGYDAFGRRLLKSAAVATWFTYGGQNGALTEEARTVGPTTDYVYLDPSSRAEAFFPVAEIENSTGRGGTVSQVYYIHADRIGTPQTVTDGGQTVRWTTTYLPFGETGTITGSITQNLRLPGQYYDSETGLDHNGARDYNPVYGVYIQTDPIGLAGGTTNTYASVRQNPFRFTDTSGRESFPFQNALPPVTTLNGIPNNLPPRVNPIAPPLPTLSLRDQQQAQQLALLAQLPLLLTGDVAALGPFLATSPEAVAAMVEGAEGFAPCASVVSSLLSPSWSSYALTAAGYALDNAPSFLPWEATVFGRTILSIYDTYDYVGRVQDYSNGR